MTNAKSKILAAAESLIFEKGISKTTISEISTKAGVVDSHVYQFFKGKDQLLFCVAQERMEEVISQLTEHLEGITDAQSRLRKMIWFSLNYNDSHRGYARMLLFECRSNKDFYSTPAYQLIRKYSGILLSILEQGVADKSFRDDTDMHIVRDIILGTLDFEAIRCISNQQNDSWVKDHEGIISLILPMIQVKPGLHTPGKKDKILAAAEKVFAQKGFARAQISEIASLANVADGTIYEYFKNKEDLLLSIPEKRFSEEMEKLSDAFSTQNPLKKLKRMIRDHFTFHLNNREFLKVFLVNILLNDRFYRSKAYGNYKRYLDLIDGIIEEGKAENSFKKDINPDIFKSMFLGTFSNMALRWLILENDLKNDKMMEIDRLVDLFSSSVSADQPA